MYLRLFLIQSSFFYRDTTLWPVSFSFLLKNLLSTNLAALVYWQLPTIEFFFFLPHLEHMGILEPRIKSKLQLQSIPQLPHAEFLAHCTRPEMELVPSQQSELLPRQCWILNPLSHSVNSPSFSWSEKVLISPSILEDNFARFRILVRWVLFSPSFKYFTHRFFLG